MITQAGNDQAVDTPQPLHRTTRDSQVMEGKACIRGMRVTVGMIVGQIGAGRTVQKVLEDFPYLEREDVLEALQYAAQQSQELEIVLATVGVNCGLISLTCTEKHCSEKPDDPEGVA